MNELDFQRRMDSARERMLGLSADSEYQDNQANPDVQDRTSQSLGANRNSDASLSLKDHVQGSGQDMRRDSDVTVSGKQAEQVQSISELEKKGTAELLNEDDLNKKFQEYPFLFARAGDLTIADVESLLNSYKHLVLRYVALAQGMGVSPETTLTQNGQTSDLVVSEEPEILNSVVKDNENSAIINKNVDDVISLNHHSEAVDTEASEQMNQRTAVDSSDDLEALGRPENA
ncbi:Vacuolar protein sorting-associated protein 9A [Zea mays]|nr:Vacuolar protein sorting-associated protein 9A [Zea mays]